MPIRYRIHPELNLAFVICTGDFTAPQYFQVLQEIFKDKDYRRGMPRIVDLLEATAIFDLEDIRAAITFSEELVKALLPLDHTILLTNSGGLHQFVQSVKLMAEHRVTLRFDAFYSLDEMITALDLSQRRYEILHFYQDCLTYRSAATA